MIQGGQTGKHRNSQMFPQQCFYSFPKKTDVKFAYMHGKITACSARVSVTQGPFTLPIFGTIFLLLAPWDMSGRIS